MLRNHRPARNEAESLVNGHGARARVHRETTRVSCTEGLCLGQLPKLPSQAVALECRGDEEVVEMTTVAHRNHPGKPTAGLGDLIAEIRCGDVTLNGRLADGLQEKLGASTVGQEEERIAEASDQGADCRNVGDDGFADFHSANARTAPLEATVSP